MQFCYKRSASWRFLMRIFFEVHEVFLKLAQKFKPTTNVYFTILGIYGYEQSDLHFFGHPIFPFLGTWKRALLPKVPNLGNSKMMQFMKRETAMMSIVFNAEVVSLVQIFLNCNNARTQWKPHFQHSSIYLDLGRQLHIIPTIGNSIGNYTKSVT